MRTSDRRISPQEQGLRLLFVGEYPPSNHHGGAILLKRLLESHPSTCLTVITSRTGMDACRPTGILSCQHIVIPGLAGVRCAWMRSLMHALDWLTLVMVAFRGTEEIRSRHAHVLISVVQGRFYLAAAFVAWVTKTPHVAIVHDNFTPAYLSRSSLVRRMKLHLTKRVLRQAASVYAVSPQMSELIFRECGVQAELQMPATEFSGSPAERLPFGTEDGPIIVFAGQVGYTVRDSLDLLAELLKSGRMQQYGSARARLHIYSNLTKAQCDAMGWDHEDIVCRGWVPQDRLASVLRDADILFLPYSFCAEAREAVETAFPSKTADYLAAGKPILIVGPEYSTLVRYASQEGFASIVAELSEEALARRIQQIVMSPAYREMLATKALSVLSANHDIRRQRSRFYAELERIAAISQQPTRSCGPPQ